jgi:prefoldin subunit 5
MVTMATKNTELRRQIIEYGSFISRKLQPQLQTAVEAREETEAEISEYAQLQNKIRQIEATIVDTEHSAIGSSPIAIDAVVDIAHATVFCNTTIPNPRNIFVNVGFGFHVEMQLQEASQFIDKRIRYLEKGVLKHRLKAAATVAKDVENALELLEELGEDLADLEGPAK